jgi:carboxypeptidase family protein
MKRTAKTIPALALALISLAGTLCAQQSAPATFGFAIHTPGSSAPPVWTLLPESGHIVKVLDCSTYPHDAHWDIVHTNEPRPNILEFAFAVAENAVVFTVTADYLDRFRTVGTPVESGPLPQAFSMGSYMAGETRSIRLDSMTEAGLPPVTIDIFITPPGHAASLSGRVTDANGHPMANVTVHLQPEQEGNSVPPFTTTTAADGTYSFTKLEPGAYTLDGKKQLNLTAGMNYVK